jgi:branched-chain amino acid transport system substrate-binding protein
MNRRIFLAQGAGVGFVAVVSPDSRAAFIEGMSRVGGLDVVGYTNLRFTKGERAGSRFVDLSLASRNAGLV